VEKFENHWDITIKFKSPYMIPKGSVAIDGISLTIHEIVNDSIRFQIIPETIKNTNIPEWNKNYIVNIETDYLVKAIDHIVRWREENK
jgi:riboflavin synthase